MSIAALIEAGAAKLDARRKAAAAERQAEEDGKMGVRLSAWMDLIDAAAKEAPEIANFLQTEMPEDWDIPGHAEATFAVPGCYPFIIRFDRYQVHTDEQACQSKYEWRLDRSGNERGYGYVCGKFVVRFPTMEYGHDEPWIGHGKREGTDDVGEALALALEAEVEHLKVQKQVAEQKARIDARAAKRKAAPAEPTVQERLLDALEAFIKEQIPEPVE
jgi:hypothetical protein